MLPRQLDRTGVSSTSSSCPVQIQLTQLDGIGREVIRHGVLDDPEQLFRAVDTADAELV